MWHHPRRDPTTIADVHVHSAARPCTHASMHVRVCLRAFVSVHSCVRVCVHMFVRVHQHQHHNQHNHARTHACTHARHAHNGTGMDWPLWDDVVALIILRCTQVAPSTACVHSRTHAPAHPPQPKICTHKLATEIQFGPNETGLNKLNLRSNLFIDPKNWVRG